MSIEVRLYGNLKLKVPSTQNPAGSPAIFKVDPGEASEVSDVFRILELEEDETSHIFVNGDYSGLKRKVENGDRAAIFPRDMALLYRWYFSKSGSEAG